MPPRTHRRSTGSRCLAVVVLAILIAAAIAAASGAPRPGAGDAAPWRPGAGAPWAVDVLFGLAILAALNCVAAFGDRVTLDERGIEVRNVWLAWAGRRSRRVAWEDITWIREHHGLRPSGRDAAPRAIFLGVRSGRRLVLDALEDFDAVIRVVRARVSTPPACPPR
jgi:hypothetical protein